MTQRKKIVEHDLYLRLVLDTIESEAMYHAAYFAGGYQDITRLAPYSMLFSAAANMRVIKSDWLETCVYE